MFTDAHFTRDVIVQVSFDPRSMQADDFPPESAELTSIDINELTQHVLSMVPDDAPGNIDVDYEESLCERSARRPMPLKSSLKEQMHLPESPSNVVLAVPVKASPVRRAELKACVEDIQAILRQGRLDRDRTRSAVILVSILNLSETCISKLSAHRRDQLGAIRRRVVFQRKQAASMIKPKYIAKVQGQQTMRTLKRASSLPDAHSKMYWQSATTNVVATLHRASSSHLA